MKTKNFKLFNVAVLLLAVSMFTVSCKKDDPEDEKPEVMSKTIDDKDVTDYGKWYYFSFAEDKFIGEGSSDPATGDDAAWKERTDWDIAFHRNNVRTNGGASGNGNGGIMLLETEDFDSVKDFTMGEFTMDTMEEGAVIAEFVMPPSYLDASINTAVNHWTVYSMEDHLYHMQIKNVFIVKTADNKYAKMQFTNFYNDNDEGGYISLKYAYQSNGSATFE
ncbi:MAG: hypothetical protein CR968_02835 [Flavobacteriia bacterium]|nr:MAG: hypothetical protein CR968_02835 [Flavobacteriia bacterium]